METFRFPFVFRFRIRLGFRFRFRFKWMRSECVWVQVRVRVLAFRAIHIFMLDRILCNIFSYLHWLKYDQWPHWITSPTCSPSLSLSLPLSLYGDRIHFIVYIRMIHKRFSSRVESSRNLIRFSTCSNGETINKALDKCPSTLSLSLSLSPPSLSVSLSILDYFLIVFEANTDWRLTGKRVEG